MLEATGAVPTAIEWTAFDYGETTGARIGAGTRSGAFELNLDPGVQSAQVKVLGAGEVLSSASVRYVEPTPPSGPGAPVPEVLVTFDGNGGTWDGQPTLTVPVPVGAPIGVPEGIVRPGHVCIGFYQQVDDGWKPVDFDTFRVESAVTLTAQWGTPTLTLDPASQQVSMGEYAALAAKVEATPELAGVVPGPSAPYDLDPALLELALDPTCAIVPTVLDGRSLSIVVETPYAPGKVSVTASYDGSADATAEIDVTKPDMVAVYRLWNPYDGSHLITSDVREYETLQPLGWRAEGVRFYQLATGGAAIYRLYNPYNGDHLYTTSGNEYRTLQGIGWRGEGLKLHGSLNSPYPVYRLWNRLQTANGGLGSHLWTPELDEYESLPTLVPDGWQQEGVAWYAAELPHAT